MAEETTRLASIQLASVPEETTGSFAGFQAPYTPPQPYREWIQSVSVSEGHIRSNLSSHSGQSESNYSSISGASSSYMSNISGYSTGPASTGTAHISADELTKIAHKMISDGYTQRMVQDFEYGSEHDQALETWLAELDINWVFQMREKNGCKWWFELRDKSASHVQELAERWMRALTIIVVSVKELVAAVHETPVVGRFGKASISAMLIFVEAIVDVYNPQKLQAMLHMYISVSNASYDMSTMHVVTSSDIQWIFNEIVGSFETIRNMLIVSISETMMHVRKTLMKDDDTRIHKFGDSWSIEIMRGRGEVHKNTRLMVDYIVLMRKAHARTQYSSQRHNTAKLHDLIHDTVVYMKDQLLTISKLCLDPSLRYMFLLNNFYHVALVSEPSISLDVDLSSGLQRGLEFIPECQKYMDSYFAVSWGHVMSSCISSSKFPGPLGRWINTSSMAKFQSVFHKTYKAQKLRKVSDPWLRSLLQETITKRVISGYRDYLKKHPKLEEYVNRRSDCPAVLEEMVGELFEG